LEVFEAVMHDAALRAAAGEMPKDRLWLFRDARERCLEITEAGLQPEESELEEHALDVHAPAQIARLEPSQLAVWIAGAPDPQRSVLALFYLDEFDHDELLAMTELKTSEMGKLLADGRQQFQAWLNAVMPPEAQAE
jgi:DNA-directed RNA polymerase specialized sigma24 family protein